MKTQIIILAGKAQSGKDTSVEYISKLLENKKYKVEQYSFAYELKKFLQLVFNIPENQLFGTNEEKDRPTHIRWSNMPLSPETINGLRTELKAESDFMTARHLMQVVGSEICRKIWDNCWVHNTLHKIYMESDNCDYALISDARFPNELDYLILDKDSEYAKYIERKPIVIHLTRNVLNKKHQSETALDNYNFNKLDKNYYRIDNQHLNQEEKEEILLNILKERFSL